MDSKSSRKQQPRRRSTPTRPPAPGADWARFQRSLAQCLGLLRDGEYLILAQRHGRHYVQFARGKTGELRAEARSNAYIEGPEPKLGRRAFARMLELGWHPPTEAPPELRAQGTRDRGGSPNFYLDAPPPIRTTPLARLAVQTLTEVYRTRHPSDLHYQAFHRQGERIRLPLALVEPAEPRPAPSGRDVPMIRAAVNDVLPDARVEADDGWVLVETDDGLIGIGPQADGVLGIWGALLDAPDPSPALHEAMNVENLWLDGVKVVAVRGQVFLVMELLPGWISRAALGRAIEAVATALPVSRRRVRETAAWIGTDEAVEGPTARSEGRPAPVLH